MIHLITLKISNIEIQFYILHKFIAFQKQVHIIIIIISIIIIIIIINIIIIILIIERKSNASGKRKYLVSSVTVAS